MVEVPWQSVAGSSCAANGEFYVYRDMTTSKKKVVMALRWKVALLTTNLSLRNYKK